MIIVIIVFLQSWRMAIVPIVAIPVSLIGTLAVLYAFGFSLNMLTLFGLVLAVGIVVDDAIVVVENVERNIARRPGPARRLASHHGRGRHGGARHLAGADRGLRADRLHSGHFRAVLPAVRHHHRGLDRDLGVQFADAVAGARRRAVQAASFVCGAAALHPGALGPRARQRFQQRLRQDVWIFMRASCACWSARRSRSSPCSPCSRR